MKPPTPEQMINKANMEPKPTHSRESSAANLAVIDITDELPPVHRELMRHTLRPLIEEAPKESEKVPEKTFRDLQWEQLLDLLREQSQTPEGRHLLDHLLPPEDRAGVEYRFAEIAEVMELLDTDPAPPLGGLHDIRKAVHHVTLDGTLVVDDLAAINRNCDVAARVCRYFKSRTEKLPALSQVGRLIDPCKSLRSRLSEAIEPGGRLSDHASPDLGRLRRAVQNQHDRISTRVDQLIKADRFEHSLRDDYFTIREDRYVLPIRIGAKGEVAGIVHAYSSSGQTAFIEPSELVELNNQLRWAQIELQDEIDRILERLSRMVASHASVLFRNIELMAYLDVVVAAARFGRTIDASVPQISEGRMELHRARHPLLYLKLKTQKDGEITSDAVPNDIAIDPPRKALIISGPNTGGKTVALKTTGLCALLARFGLPLPVDEESVIPLFDSIYTDIGDEQSIERDLSTFSGHVNNINGFLHHCDTGSLVLLDELFVGTDPIQGAALAAALLEDLVQRDATTVVTTHLEGLKTLAYQSDAFANASMGFDLDTLSPTYEMTMGIPGRSYAVRIAARLGLDDAVVERTGDILSGQDHQNIEEVLQGLEVQVQQLEDEKERLQKVRQKAERREQRYREKYQTLLEKDRKDLFDETRQLRQELRDARELIRRQLKDLQSERVVERGDVSHRELHDMQDRLQQAESTLEEAREETRPPEPGPEGLVGVEPQDLELGMMLYCKPFKRQGQVISIDEGAEEARVQLGDLKATVAFDDLFHSSESSRRDHHRGRSHSHSRRAQNSADNGGRSPDRGEAKLLPQTSDNSVDLRGLRVDEALERVDLFLDSAYLNNIDAVYVIHGHGTGALKRAVRGHLPQSRYVERFRRGERNEGGDGVTIAFLTDQA